MILFKLSNPIPLRSEYESEHVYLDTSSLPASVDWRKKNVVNPVMSEGQCGATLFIAIKESLESIYAIKKGKLLTFSA